MDPVTLGVAAATLVGAFFTKLVEKAGEKTGEGAVGTVGKLVDWLKGRFTPEGDPDGAKALARLEDVPDSPRLQDALAQAIAGKAKADPAFKADLEKLVSQAQDAGTGAISQTAVGNRNTQIADTYGSTITIGQNGNTGHPQQEGTTQQGTDQ